MAENGNDLFRDNRRLIRFTLRKFPRRIWRHISWQEAYQTGLVVLWRCSVKYNGLFAFSTYVCKSIRWAVLREIRRNSRAVSVSISAPWEHWFNVTDGAVSLSEMQTLTEEDPIMCEFLIDDEAAGISRQLQKCMGRDWDILRRRLSGETLLMIAERYKITRERVRQLEMRAIERLKRHMNRLTHDYI